MDSGCETKSKQAERDQEYCPISHSPEVPGFHHQVVALPLDHHQVQSQGLADLQGGFHDRHDCSYLVQKPRQPFLVPFRAGESQDPWETYVRCSL